MARGAAASEKRSCAGMIKAHATGRTRPRTARNATTACGRSTEPARSVSHSPFIATGFTPSFRGLLATAAGSIAGFAFFPPPATGSSNDRWRRSAVGLARLCLADQLATPLELAFVERADRHVACRECGLTGGHPMHDG